MQRTQLIIILPSLIYSLAYADISTDGSVGPAQVLNASNGQYTIGQQLGSLRGSNLFHSFQQFNINTGESAAFTGSNSIQNVISRVTGGSASNINGILKSQVGTADFYFINPAGVIFGAEAQVDVPAAFHMSTAGELKFSDGASFSALNPGASTLTIAEPQGFGFTQGQSGTLQIIGGQLSFKPGSTVSLSANGLTIAGIEQDNGEIQQAAIFVQQADATIEQGIHLNLSSVDAETSQSIPVNGLAATATGGELHISNSEIDSSGNGFGQIGIRAGGVTLENSLLWASNTGDKAMSAGDGINAHVQFLGLNNAGLISNALGKGHAGRVLVRANDTVQLFNGSLIASATFDAGNTGNIEVGGRDILIDGQGSGILSGAQPDSQGEMGIVAVKASESVQVLDGGGISSLAFGVSDAGNVTVTGNDVQVLDGGMISSVTFGGGDAGHITVTGKGILVNGQGFVTGIFSNAEVGSQGRAGTVLVNASESVQVLEGGTINSDTFGAGDAGSVTVEGRNILVDGQGLVAGIFSNAGIGSQGRAGIVLVKASESVQVLNGGAINSDTFGMGDAGNVTVEGRSILIDGQGGSGETSIGSDALSGSQGNAGLVLVSASEGMQILNGGRVSALAFSVGNAGSVTVEGNDVLIDGQGSRDTTYISSNASSGSQGHAGTVLVSANADVQVLNGGGISSSTFSTGDAGSVTVEGRNVLIDGQGNNGVTSISSDSETQLDSNGKAGTVSVKAIDGVQVLNGGSIRSVTFTAGEAGNIAVEAREVVVDGRGSVISSSAQPGSQGEAGAGAVLVNASEVVQVLNGGVISSATHSERDGGSVTVKAGEVVQILKGGLISSDTFSAGDAGSVIVEAEKVLIDGQGSAFVTGIFSDANTDSQGKAGTVSVSASDIVQLLNRGKISSDVFGAGDGGSVTVKAGEVVQVFSSGQISSDTSSIGDAGSVIVDAKKVLVDGQGGEFATGIFSDAITDSQGKAGTVSVSASDTVQVLNGGLIRSDTAGVGDAGSVVVKAAKVLVQGNSHATSISSSVQQGGEGNAGTVIVTASKTIQLLSGGGIDSITFGAGDAGSVTVKANEVLVDGQGSNSSTGISSNTQPGSQGGNAGTVRVAANNSVQVLNGGVIDSDTNNIGSAGDVTVEAREVLVDGQGSGFATGIKSSAQLGSQGNAGTVLVRASEMVQVLDGGTIDSITAGAGNAGDVTVEAENILIDGQGRRESTAISSTSTFGSSGQVGNVSVVVTDQIIVRDGSISIASLNEQLQSLTSASESPARLSISAPTLQLEKNAAITAATEGGVNAAPIEIDVTGSLNIENSQISTSAVNGNGGSISINVGNWLQLQQSQITTSVSGQENGNGGDININTPAIILNTGFIQANTAAVKAQGGDINLQVRQLIPSANSLLVGGNNSLEFDPEQSNFNVVQAASPTGVNGAINISSPELNITGVLASVNIPELNLERLGQDPCIRQRENSLQSLGHGGVPALQYGENYMQINRLGDMDKQRENQGTMTPPPEIQINHLQKQSVLTDCENRQLSFSQVGY